MKRISLFLALMTFGATLSLSAPSYGLAHCTAKKIANNRATSKLNKANSTYRTKASALDRSQFSNPIERQISSLESQIAQIQGFVKDAQNRMIGNAANDALNFVLDCKLFNSNGSLANWLGLGTRRRNCRGAGTGIRRGFNYAGQVARYKRRLDAKQSQLNRARVNLVLQRAKAQKDFDDAKAALAQAELASDAAEAAYEACIEKWGR